MLLILIEKTKKTSKFCGKKKQNNFFNKVKPFKNNFSVLKRETSNPTLSGTSFQPGVGQEKLRRAGISQFYLVFRKRFHIIVSNDSIKRGLRFSKKFSNDSRNLRRNFRTTFTIFLKSFLHNLNKHLFVH